VTINVDGITVTGAMAVDSKGVAACGAYLRSKAGFEYDWSTGSIAFLGTKGCTEAGF
jgi:hypothetical protein